MTIGATTRRSGDPADRRHLKSTCSAALNRAAATGAGFTLIELILVMTLLAIVLTVASPSLSRFFRGRSLDSEAHRFLALTRAAQTRAVSEGVPIVVWFDSKSRAYGLNADRSFVEDDPKAEQFTVDDTLEVEVVYSAEAQYAGRTNLFKSDQPTTSGLYQLRFNPDGFASAASPETVVFRQGESAEMRVARSRNRLSYEIQAGRPVAGR